MIGQELDLPWIKIYQRLLSKVFVDLYKKKLIYKDKKLVNWDTKLQTAISDLEVVQRDVQSQLYYIEYPILNSKKNNNCHYKTRNNDGGYGNRCKP